MSEKEVLAKKPDERTEEEKEVLYQAKRMRKRAAAKAEQEVLQRELAVMERAHAEEQAQLEEAASASPLADSIAKLAKEIQEAVHPEDSDDELEYESREDRVRREAASNATRAARAATPPGSTAVPAPTPPTPTSGQPPRTSPIVDHE